MIRILKDQMQSLEIKPIAVLRTPFVEKFGTPRQGSLAPTAHARVEFAPGSPAELWLRGLEGFSHVWLIGVFHNHMESAPPLVRPPRLGGKAVGVLASRSPHRPNPISLTLAKVVACERDQLIVAGVDLMDGTPILDIKPYIPETDFARDAKAGWVEANPWPELPVRLSTKALGRLTRIYELAPPPIGQDEFIQLIKETLKSDPRAVADREKTVENGAPRLFWVRLFDVDVCFSFVDGAVQVDDVRFAIRSPLYAQFEDQEAQGH
jgi:tRNA-Thr(GGU) m(6)t(6)A37 methyltransferase TsaA